MIVLRLALAWACFYVSYDLFWESGVGYTLFAGTFSFLLVMSLMDASTEFY